MGKYINDNQFKIDYTRKIKFLIKWKNSKRE